MSDLPNSNERTYPARNGGSYLSTRILTHAGVAIAFALRRSNDNTSLFFDYSVLDTADQDSNSTDKSKSKDAGDLLDSQRWPDNPKTLEFPSELRVVGEEALPVYVLRAFDRTDNVLKPEEIDRADSYRSTSLCLMDPSTANFEVMSDGQYIYLFRQSRAAGDDYLKRFLTSATSTKPPINSNLLCDRFTLVGTTLMRTLEVRYRRSRQKRLPLNEKDTLAVRDINDTPFYEPTFSLQFVKDMQDGRFTVVQTPTMTNGIFKWTIFAYSSKIQYIVCFTCDVAINGLFDVHGQIYYTCDNAAHQKTFSTIPGPCSAMKTDGHLCDNVKKVVVPKPASSQCSLSFDLEQVDPHKKSSADEQPVKHNYMSELRLNKPIDLSSLEFAVGFTLEAWIKPSASENKSEPGESDHTETSNSPPAGGKTRLFTLSPGQTQTNIIGKSVIDQQKFLSVSLNENLQVIAHIETTDQALTTSKPLEPGTWSHVALTFAAGSSSQISLIVDGELSETSTVALESAVKPGYLETIIPHLDENSSRFHGDLDEVRLWTLPLHPATVKSRMLTRATGIEPYLEACWHFDEGEGTKIFDSTQNAHDATVFVKTSLKDTDITWSTSAAPLLSSTGLYQRVIRSGGIEVAGGLHAAIYYEQVTVDALAAEAPKDENAAAETEKAEAEKSSSASKKSGGDDRQPNNPMKREARVLLCFVAKKLAGTVTALAILDFGILSNGALADWPATINIPAVSVIGNERKYGPTSLLWSDSQGMELFGGYLDFNAARCSPDPPCVWDSATGAVTIFYKGQTDPSKPISSADVGKFSALIYDISRSIRTNTSAALPGQYVACTLRQADKVSILIEKAPVADEDVAVNVTISAQIPTPMPTPMPDGWTPDVIEETWQHVPSDIQRLSDLLSGRISNTTTKIGIVAEFYQIEGNTRKQIKVVLKEPLSGEIRAATCIQIEKWLFLVQLTAPQNTKELVVALLKKLKTATKKPGVDSEVISLVYDHENMLVRSSKRSASLTSGSAIITMVPSASGIERQGTVQGTLVKPTPDKIFVTVHNKSPRFASPAPTSALQLKDDIVYTMLEPTVTTKASSGLTFESWLKVNKATESVLVAYTSQRTARNEGSSPDQQTFVLTIPANSNEQENYELACNANGILFSLKDKSLKTGQWLHLACSLHNTLALNFSGPSFVDFGSAAQFNVQDFSLVFTLQLKAVKQQQILFTKAPNAGGNTPVQVEITRENTLRLSFWAEDENPSADSKPQLRTVTSPLEKPLIIDTAYKVFISRKLEPIQKTAGKPRQAQFVTMIVWHTDGSKLFEVQPPTMNDLEKAENDNKSKLAPDTAVQACGGVPSNDSPFFLGGAPWSEKGLNGIIGPVRLYSNKIKVPDTVSELVGLAKPDRGLIAAWSFQGDDTSAVFDDTSQNVGKLKGGPQWTLSPFSPDHQLVVYVNGEKRDTSLTADAVVLRTPAGPHQLTLGNSLHANDDRDPFRFQCLPHGFYGEFDELRIWNTARTRINICDAMNAKLSEIPPELAVYLPFDVDDVENLEKDTTGREILTDNSINCWHLTPLYGAAVNKVVSQAPVGRDATCVQHVHGTMQTDNRGADTLSSPSATEYGMMSTGANGSLEGSYKRAYSYIDSKSCWRLDTGFKIGALTVQWISQVQTSPTLQGYIEGAPPVPLENYSDERHPPMSSIKFSNANSVQYSYGLRTESSTDYTLNTSSAVGGKWDISAGVGVQTEVSEGKIKAGPKTTLDISNAGFNNNFVTMKSHTNLDMKMELIGSWNSKETKYELTNTGLALVESEVADVFALRLKMRGPVAPLVAYQMRPNPDIPKDRNLVSFEINPQYTKQGCLNGLKGTGPDPDYPLPTDAPKDASYFKPAEAYALKERIRRAEEQLAGEYDRYTVTGNKSAVGIASRVHRNICNSYVWTADGGSFQETHSTMDFIQAEVGGNSSTRSGMGATLESEIDAACLLGSLNVDALYSTYVNVMQTKDKQTEEGFELIAELPQPINIRELDNKKLKREGLVDTFRWMSFWLEPSVEGTDAFFKQVVDPKWLSESSDSDAILLRELQGALQKESGNARTKAWRLLHRVTFVSRALPQASPLQNGTTTPAENVNGALLADISCNWLMVQRLEPLIRGASSYQVMAKRAEKDIAEHYPTLRADPKFYSKLLDLLAAYIGVK